MEIQDSQINDGALTDFGFQAAKLIKEEKHEELAKLYGYALSFGSAPSDIIQSEIQSCLKQAGNNAKLSIGSTPHISLKYFEPNSSNLVAVVECSLSIEGSTGIILVELILTGSDAEHHLSLEQISYAA